MEKWNKQNMHELVMGLARLAKMATSWQIKVLNRSHFCQVFISPSQPHQHGH
jgi:hypothetical protein